MLLAMTVIPVIDVAAKQLVDQMNTFQIAFWRSIVHVLIFLPFLLRIHGTVFVRPKSMKMQIMRGVTLTLTYICMVQAIRENDIPVVLAIIFIDPIVIMLLSPFLLGEKFGKLRMLAALVGFCGVIIVTNPFGGDFNIWLLFAPIAGVCFALYQIITKMMSETDDAVTTSYFTGFVGIVMLLPFCVLDLSFPTGKALGLVLMMGGASAAGHYLIVLAFRYADASLVGTFGYFELVTATIYSAVIFNFVPMPNEILGMFVIVGAGLFIAWRERRA